MHDAACLFGPPDLARSYSFALDHLAKATAAIAHPLGFLMLEQVPDGQGGYHRIHVWRRERAPAATPHSHSGDLRSTILLGRMRNHLWNVEAGYPSSTPIIEVEKVGRDDRAYRLVGQARCVIAESREFVPGESYTIPAGVYHSNEVVTELCVTFVERRRSTGGLAQVAISPEAAIASERTQMDIEIGELTAVAEALREQAFSLGLVLR